MNASSRCSGWAARCVVMRIIQHRQHEALALVRRAGGDRPGEQALDADLRLRTVAGLVLTPERRVLRSRWLWVGGAIAFLIFLPNLLWNVQHHFPFLELQENIRRSGRNVGIHAADVSSAQEILTMLPLTAPIWMAGLWRLVLEARFARWRGRGLIAAALIMALNPRMYYLFPAFPLLFAAGSVAWEQWLARPRWRWIRLGVRGADGRDGRRARADGASRCCRRRRTSGMRRRLHIQQPRIENHQLGPLPQLFADQFGWEEMAADGGAGVYNGLPPDVQAKTAIFGQNYGQAGAIDLFGPKYGLPTAISGHQSYYLVGAARVHGREHDRHGRPAGPAGTASSRRSEGGRGSSIRTRCPTSISTCSTAGVEAAAGGVVAAGEAADRWGGRISFRKASLHGRSPTRSRDPSPAPVLDRVVPEWLEICRDHPGTHGRGRARIGRAWSRRRGFVG